MSKRVVLTGSADIVATIPHLLGARPENSVVVLPIGGGQPRPTVRIDIPEAAAGNAGVAKALANAFAPHAGGDVAVVAFADQIEAAGAICEATTRALEPDTTVVAQIATQSDTWVRLDDPQWGTISEADRDRVAVAFIAAGNRQPYQSLDQLRASFAPKGEDLSAAVAAATGLSETDVRWAPTKAAEEHWMTHVIEGFVANGRPLAAPDAARLIGDVQTVLLRDHAFSAMTREESRAHAALWKDLLTRCPEPARTPVATLAAFGAWLHGNGMQARLALEQVTEPTDRMAQLVRRVLDVGLNPAGWSHLQRAETQSPEYYDPPARHDPRRDPPTPKDGPGRPGPSR